MRVGLGYDVHRLVKGRKLVLGGAVIPHVKGLLGHSDADVLVHAACDALLGAAGLGDIGQHFPDSDPAFKDIYSIELLERSYAMVREKSFQMVNLDATIFAQSPKLSPFKAEMENNLARALKTDATAINIKATTTEGVGLIGREEAMAAMCIVLLEKL
jgi:2-C-methyl-D-erythritol 2,4-cyclodiphosphate synthase